MKRLSNIFITIFIVSLLIYPLSQLFLLTSNIANKLTIIYYDSDNEIKGQKTDNISKDNTNNISKKNVLAIRVALLRFVI